MAHTDVLPAASERRDFLAALIQFLYVVAPLEILLIFVGTTKLTAGMVTGALLGLVGLLLFASSRLSLSWRADRPMVYMLVFLGLAAFSTLQTPYGAPAIQKGAVNLIAMLAMLSMVLVVKRAFTQWPNLFPHVVRITAITTAISGLTVIFQSFVSNVLAQPELFDLTFVNALVGQTWWDLAIEGGIVRAHGIFAEPAFLASYIAMASGLALIRLGLFGSQSGRDLRALVPLWAAWSVLMSLLLSFSAVVYAGLLVTCLGALASRVNFSIRSIFVFATGSVIVILVLAFLAMQMSDAIVDRIAGLAILSQLDVNGNTQLDPEINFSVQVLFLNAYIALRNLLANPLLGAGVGAHPFAYEALLPALPVASAGNAVGLNAMDASALTLRLLSETGLLGTLMFTSAIVSAWLRVRKVVLHSNSVHQPLRTMAIGLNACLAGVFAAMMFRIPHYYAAEFWSLFALCVTIPALAPMSGSVILRPPRRDA